MPAALRHFDVYGLIVSDGRVLLVRKVRGPYRGLLDLPGGTPDHGEIDARTTLDREILEETGLVVREAGAWRPFAFHLTRDAEKHAVDFHHCGVWAEVSVALGASARAAASSDTDGCVRIERVNWAGRTDLSQLVRTVLAAADRSV